MAAVCCRIAKSEAVERLSVAWYLLVLTGSSSTQRSDEEINGVIDWHLHPDRQAVWTDVEHPKFMGGMRLVAKMAGAKVLALTGSLVDGKVKHEPIEVDGRTLHYRYDVDWDQRPPRWVPVEEVGEPFDQTTRQMRFISDEEWRRAYRALHGEDPPRQDASPPEWMSRVGRGRR